MKKICFITMLAVNFLSCTASAEDNAPYPTLVNKTWPYPASYTEEASHRGRVERIDYDTRDYAEGTDRARTNTAYVYLPYGYDDNAEQIYIKILIYKPVVIKKPNAISLSILA